MDTKDRYIESMLYIAKSLRDYRDKKPTKRVINMGVCLREIMFYVNELESKVADYEFDPNRYHVPIDKKTKARIKYLLNK